MSKILVFSKALLTSQIVWFSLGAMTLIGMAFDPIIGSSASFASALVASLLVYGNLCLSWRIQRKKLHVAFNNLANDIKQKKVLTPTPKAGSFAKVFLTSPIIWGYFGVFWLIQSTFRPITGEFAAFASGLIASLLVFWTMSQLWPAEKKKLRIAGQSLQYYYERK